MKQIFFWIINLVIVTIGAGRYVINDQLEPITTTAIEIVVIVLVLLVIVLVHFVVVIPVFFIIIILVVIVSRYIRMFLRRARVIHISSVV